MILFLIQIGGMGVVTVSVAVAIFSGRKISLMQRSTMRESISAPQVGGIVRMTEFILKTVFLVELLGAVAMAPVFVRDFGFLKGVWYAMFHSISAFCNAGFDLIGIRSPFSSLTTYASQPVINLTIMALIIVGGIGFLTWEDVKRNRLHFSRYRMQSKVILVTTAVLIAAPAAWFFFFEFSELPLGTRLLSSLFQSVTPRTAGFNTADLTKMTEAGQMLMIVLMLIGGSPGSTARRNEDHHHCRDLLLCQGGVPAEGERPFLSAQDPGGGHPHCRSHSSDVSGAVFGRRHVHQL